MARFALTIFLGAFLLFQVQPILGRFILPWFGGGASVWTVCMLFFQVALLAGYAYAHLISKRAGPRAQLAIHLVLIGLSLVFLPITPAAESWRPTDDGGETLRILALLAMHIGVPYLLLASTGPLLQNWFDREFPGRSPYRLYSLSNLASLLALLSYPFLFEPWLTLKAQGWAWTIGFILYAAMCAWCAVMAFLVSRKDTAAPTAEAVAAGLPVEQPGSGVNPSRAATASFSPRVQQFLWIALSAVGSVMLIATTNQICQDLAVVPMLWVFPLAVYLITFIICFDADHWYHRAIFGPLLAISVLAVNYVMHSRSGMPMLIQIGSFGMALFAGCMVCHGELVRLRPDTSRLTSFYLSISIGGALGGVIVALLAPLVLPDYWEYHIGLLTVCILAAVCMTRAYLPRLPVHYRRWASVGAVALLVALGASMTIQIFSEASKDHLTIRNFYGVIRVRAAPNRYGEIIRSLWHGQTVHGTQFLDADKLHWPTSYYGNDSGIGMTIQFAAHGKVLTGKADPRQPIRVGVVGLGVGTIAAHAREGDSYRFYEINPAVEKVALTRFTFLRQSPAKTDVVIGDARLMLERELAAGKPNEFDVLAIDAFNSDSIPLHLITDEAMSLYLKHIKPNGKIAFHITNNYVDLMPVLRGFAAKHGLHLARIDTAKDIERLVTSRSIWAILTKDDAFVKDPGIALIADADIVGAPVLYWTDDFASLWSVISARGSNLPSKWGGAFHQARPVLDSADLIEPNDERKIIYLLRKTWLETRFRMMVVAVKGKTRSADGTLTLTFEQLTAAMYRDFELVNPADDTGLMLIISVDDRQIRSYLGSAWDEAAKAEAQRIVNEVVLPGVAGGKPSEAILAGIEQLEQMVRKEFERRKEWKGSK